MGNNQTVCISNRTEALGSTSTYTGNAVAGLGAYTFANNGSLLAITAELTNAQTGSVYIVNPLTPGDGNSNIFALNGTVANQNGIVINGENAGDRFGYDVNPLGDQDGDGNPEVIVAASRFVGSAANNNGAVYIVSSRTFNASTNGTIQAGNGTGFVRLLFANNGAGTVATKKINVVEVPDFDGDGKNEVLIGNAYYVDPVQGQTGVAFVVSSTIINLATGGDIELDRADYTASGIYKFVGANVGDLAGYDVSTLTIGAANNLVIGAANTNGGNGSVYVVATAGLLVGQVLAGTATLQAGAGIAEFNGQNGDNAGYSVGHVTLGGADSLLIGAVGYPNGDENGALYVVSGFSQANVTAGTNITLQPTGNATALRIVQFAGETAGDELGYSVINVPTNPFSDEQILVGAIGVNANNGTAYIIDGDAVDNAGDTPVTVTNSSTSPNSTIYEVPPTGGNNKQFGFSVGAVDTDEGVRAVVGTPYYEVNTGKVSIFALECQVTPNSTTTTASNSTTISGSNSQAPASVSETPLVSYSPFVSLMPTVSAVNPTPSAKSRTTTSGSGVVARTTGGSSSSSTGSKSTGSKTTGSKSTGSKSTGSRTTTGSAKAKRNVEAAVVAAPVKREKKSASSSAASAPAPFASLQSCDSGVVGVNLLNAANSGKASDSASSITMSADVSQVMLGAVLLKMASQVCESVSGFFSSSVVSEKVNVEAVQAVEVSKALGKVNSLIEQAQSLLAQSGASEDVAAWLSDAAQELKIASEKSVSVSELINFQVDAEALVSSIATLRSETVSVASATVFTPEVVVKATVSTQAMLAN